MIGPAGNGRQFSTFNQRNAELHMVDEDQRRQERLDSGVERLPRTWWGRIALLAVAAVVLLLAVLESVA
jgi:hypothetical protein